MVSAELQSFDCSIPHNSAASLTRHSAGRQPTPWPMDQVEDDPKVGLERDFVTAAWALLSLGSAVIHAARLIPWWLFALVLLLILARAA
jgi:hypothetical protein